jgi:Polyketide cyclase / dehydrase and lipid transport
VRVAVVFSFDAVWQLPADADTVFRVLAAAENYSLWWPEVRVSNRIDADSGVLVCRSLLPYSLRMEATREIEDPDKRILRAGLTGDLVGYSSWRVERTGGTTARAVFDQEVTTSGLPLAIASRIGPALLRWNHRHMMAGGERGLRAYLRGSSGD